MASSRAEEVAEILWELKRAEKVSTFSEIAQRAGFSAGSNGRAVRTTLKTVRRDWPHLQWWRAVRDDGLCEKDSEQVELLKRAGFEFEAANGKAKDKDSAQEFVSVASFEEHLMQWTVTTDEPLPAESESV